MTRRDLAKACLAATVLISGSAFGAWPVLRTYSGEALRRVKMPLGGIGTGTISLSGRGSLVDWELRSAPRKGFTPSHANFAPHFAIRGETADGRRFARLLEGPLLPEEYEGCEGVPVKNHGFPRFAAATFKAAYPLAQVELSDPKVPLEVRLEAMNPLVPGDAEASGIPAALLRWQVRNPTDKPMRVSVAGSLVRFGNVDLALVAVTNGATLTAADRVREPGWSAWNVPLDRYWRRFVEEGVVSDSAPSEPNGTPVFQRCLSAEVAAGGTRSFVFAIGWRYASRGAWDMWEDGRVTGPAGEVGNWYATRFASAEAAANHLLSNLPDLEAKTLAFVEKVLSVRAPDVVREAALFNLSTLRTETCFRTADGHFFGFEGCLDNAGSCYGTCTHVWGYEHCLVDLWPELARDILDQCYGPRLDQETGHMGFRVGLPLATKARASRLAAADGQMQMLVRAYEYWKKSGDAAWLKAKYPSVRKALEFCWIAGGWDADRDGVMEGCQHNTMDVEYFGPNPQMEFLYLAALEAVSAMAEACGDGAFASDLRTLRAKGSAWTEANLFNGSYYEHRIVPPKGPIAAGVRHARIGARSLSDPEFQLGAGCLVDQLVGDFAARAAGLPPVTDEAHARTTLATILAKCRRNPDDEVFNNMRDFILPGEAGLRMAWYPEGRKPRSPFPYYQETMTGFEYVVAAGLAQRGDFAAAERVVRDIRDRYDGVKRNPFDEAECGHHYVRALAAWSVLKAFADVRAHTEAEIEIVDDWLNVDCHIKGWDEKTGFRVRIDGREEFSVWQTIGGGAKHRYAFDVCRFRGKKAQVVATALGTWEDVRLESVKVSNCPDANSVVVTATVGDCLPVDVSRVRKEGLKFLCVPIRKDAPPVRCAVYDGGGDDVKPAFDLCLRLATDGRGDFHASIPLDGFSGSSVRLRSSSPVVPRASRTEFEQAVGLASEPRPGDPGTERPKLHFRAPFGGSGDMVGFFRLGETYHMGYLHDYGYDLWIENCCWSRATSTDFFNWQTALAYDRKGVGAKRTSGSCFVDVRNESGLGDGKTPPILMFGCIEVEGAQRWQRDRNDASRGPERRPDLLPRLGLKVSRDGGRTFVSVPKPILTLQAIGGHDPEVVYDAAHGTYVMVTHDRRDGVWGFDFYTSKNLLDWEYASTVPGLWETPNFYPLVCEGRTWWVLQQCLLDYLVGEFDGRVFTPQGKLNASFKGAFAPRTFETADGRRVLMAARLDAGPTGGATLPMELRLVKTAEGPRLAYRPVREMAKYSSQVSDTTEELPGDTWEVAGRKGKFLDGEPHVIRTIVDGPVTDYFVGWGVVAGTLPTTR